MAVCKCGCGEALTGNKSHWINDAHRNRYNRRKKSNGEGETESLRKENLNRIESLLLESGYDPADIGAVEKVRLNEWEGYIKNDNNEIEKTTLRAASLILTPSWDSGPKWPVIQPAKEITVKVPASFRPKRLERGPWKRAVILPDPQIGYRRFLDGTLDPFHDTRALDISLAIIAELQPDLIINLGDLVDFPEFGRYEQEPGFALTTQPTLDDAHAYLAKQRALAPDAEIRLLPGNHDVRLQNSIIKNAKAAFGIRQGGATPESWPVLSLPHLLNLDKIDVSYVEGYPGGVSWINDNLACIHGHKVRSNGSTAMPVLDDERVSVIFGHVHRIEMAYKSRRTKDGLKVNFAASPGCLCRLDGVVPSTKSSLDSFGRPVVTNLENWQAGMAVVAYEEGNGRFDYEQIFINEGRAIFRGKEYIG